VPAVLRRVSLLDQGHYSGCHWTSTAVEVGQWWAQVEFTRINIEPIILRKKIEDLREVGALTSFANWSDIMKRVRVPVAPR